MPIPPNDRQRLAKIAARFGSNHDGERATAALMATRLLHAHGLTWQDIIMPTPVPASMMPARRWRDGLAGPALAAQCATWPEFLTPWERSFLAGIASRYSQSPRQAHILADIAAKLRAHVSAQHAGARWAA